MFTEHDRILLMLTKILQNTVESLEITPVKKKDYTSYSQCLLTQEFEIVQLIHIH